ncbi:hypothetical protein PHLH3_07520 [Pseudomonas sp. St386]|nr:VENN motif-containing pre-toxin protein [Pseudomonas fluorescens]BBP51126.1 hypothetical protein PHLH3_07520 [Pseudomonas sp. St386]
MISSSISTAIGGGSFGSNFNAALLGEAGNVAMATGFNWVGDTIKFPDGGPQKIVAHAIMGGLLAELTGSDFKTGAVAAGLNEALIPGMAKVAGENKDLQLMLSQLTGLLAAAAVDGDLNTGSTIAKKATEFNYLFHAELVEREQKLNTCASPADCQSVRDYYNNLDTARNKEFGQYCRNNPASCLQVTKQLVDEIPANEKMLHDGRSAGLDRSAALWVITRGNERAINTGIIENTRTEKGEGAALLAELASDGLNQDRGLFSSTAGGKGGTTGVKVGADGAKEVAGTAAPGRTKVAATEGTFPDEVFTGKKPHQTTPGIGSVTQERYNPATGKLEKSVIEYDQYGRQVKRTDYTNHGYGNQEKPAEYHSDPHTHTYEYGPGYGSNGKETRINND